MGAFYRPRLMALDRSHVSVGTPSPSCRRLTNATPTADAVSHTKSRAGSGSGSDTDTSRADRPRIRVRNSPPGSRAQSPPPFPTLDEVHDAIPAAGIGISELVKLFRPRVVNRQGEFILLVKQAGKQDAVTKKIFRQAVLDGQAPA